MIIHTSGLEFNIRKCTNKDYRFCYNLTKKNMSDYIDRHWGGWNPKMFREYFSKGNINIVEYGNRRIGLCVFEFKKDHSYVNSIQISKKFRKKGLGTLLLDMIEKESKGRKLSKIQLGIFKENPAVKLYERLGYKKIKDYGSSIIMEKEIQLN